MKIEVLHESEHYVIINPVLHEDGSMPTRASILPILEGLRTAGYRFLSMAGPWGGPTMLCERITPKPDVSAAVAAMTDEQRMALFINYCSHCGRADRGCQCWNDE